MQAEGQTWTIGQLSQFSGLPVKTVRFYSDAGLLSAGRSPAGHRRYNSGDLARLTLVRSLRSLDVPVGNIRKLLGGLTDLPECLRAQEQILQTRLRMVRLQLAVCRASAAAGDGRNAYRLQALC